MDRNIIGGVVMVDVSVDGVEMLANLCGLRYWRNGGLGREGFVIEKLGDFNSLTPCAVLGLG